MKHIGLLDCNNFFVSCERLFRPDLQGKPVVVLSSNDGCIVARSQEIKDKGIPMGVPYFQVKDILNEIGAVRFSTNFTLYRDISKRVFEEVKNITGLIEQYSIDEAFFYMEEDGAEQYCERIKRQVEQAVGIPISIGVGPSKTIAKYQNTVAKKTTGVSIWDNDKWPELANNITLAELWGVGPSRSRSFTEKSLRTIADYLALDISVVSKLYGVEGTRLYSELKGVSKTKLKSYQESQKSIISSRSFSKSTTDKSVIADAIKYHLYQAVTDLKNADLLTNNIQIMIMPSRHGDYFMQGARESFTLEQGTRDLFLLQEVCMKLLDKAYKAGVPYNKAGVSMSGLIRAGGETKSLFMDQNTNKTEARSIISNIVLELNNRLGKDSLLVGRFSRRGKVWQSKQELLSPNYTTNWSEIKTVKAK